MLTDSLAHRSLRFIAAIALLGLLQVTYMLFKIIAHITQSDGTGFKPQKGCDKLRGVATA